MSVANKGCSNICSSSIDEIDYFSFFFLLAKMTRSDADILVAINLTLLRPGGGEGGGGFYPHGL